MHDGQHVLTRRNNADDGIYYGRTISSAKSMLHSNDKCFPNSRTRYLFFPLYRPLFNAGDADWQKSVSFYRRSESSSRPLLYEKKKKQVATLVKTSVGGETFLQRAFFTLIFFLRLHSARGIKFPWDIVKLIFSATHARSTDEERKDRLFVFSHKTRNNLMPVINFLSGQIYAS